MYLRNENVKVEKSNLDIKFLNENKKTSGAILCTFLEFSYFLNLRQN